MASARGDTELRRDRACHPRASLPRDREDKNHGWRATPETKPRTTDTDTWAPRRYPNNRHDHKRVVPLGEGGLLEESWGAGCDRQPPQPPAGEVLQDLRD